MNTLGDQRELTEAERRLISRLIENTPQSVELSEALIKLRVISLNDGGMGSLRLLAEGQNEESRKMGRCLKQIEFLDADMVTVLASLDLDCEGRLFELDLWKTDFSPLIRLPE